jgi:hypothetical protein
LLDDVVLIRTGEVQLAPLSDERTKKTGSSKKFVGKARTVEGVSAGGA